MSRTITVDGVQLTWAQAQAVAAQVAEVREETAEGVCVVAVSQELWYVRIPLALIDEALEARDEGDTMLYVADDGYAFTNPIDKGERIVRTLSDILEAK